MTKENWITLLSKPLGKCDVLKLGQLAIEKKSATDLIDLALYAESEIAFRAAWVLECSLIYTSHKDITSNFQRFLDAYAVLDNTSCQRHFTKIFLYFLRSGKVNFIPSEKLEPIVESTFKWLIYPKTPVAVQANCIDILFNLKTRFDWIEEELKAQIVFMMRHGSAAIQSRGRKILAMKS